MTTVGSITRQDIADRLEEFIRRTGEVGPADAGFGRRVHIFEAGYLDSLGVVRLIAHLEAAYDLEFTDEELFDPRFTTIDGMSEIVAGRLESR
jgi:acyl carrier protein